MFEKIYGYESQKREIEEVINWFIDRKKYQKEGITVPKGVILHGAPGCGKTLFMKEISEKYADMVVSIDGVSEQLNEEVEKAFESIPENGRIVLIDELDLLLDKDSHLTRVLQTKMDGLMSNGNVLVIATANRLHDINDALLRAGRFDRDLKMGHPDLNDKMEILNNSLLKYKVRLQDCDIKYLATIMTNVSCAEIVSIVNDAMLRNNGQTITSVMIEDSYYRSYYGEEFKKKDNSVAKYIAMHEAGHDYMK